MTFRYALAALLACAFALFPAAQGAPETYVAPEDQRERAREISEAFSELAERIDKTKFDVDAKVDALDYDADAAADFVTNEIAFDPYVGVMRGPEGTLSAQAGSAWDQAVLLAALINAMGGEALVVRGKLREADVDRLLRLSFKERADFEPALTNADIRAVFGGKVSNETLSTLNGPGPEADAEILSTYTEGIESTSARLTAALDDAGLELGSGLETELSELKAEIGETYAWVQYRDTPNDDWKDIHPAFADDPAPWVEAEAFVSGTVPDELVHKVRVEVEIERTTGDRVETEAIMTPVEGTAASLAARQISLGIAPSRLPDGPQDIPAYFIPVVNGTLAERGKAFTLLGLTVDAETAAAGPEIFATVADRFGGALGALDGTTDGPSTAPRLTGVFVEVTLIAPGGEETTTRRRIVDFRDGVPERPDQAVLTSMVIDVGVGPENGARDAQAVLEAMADEMARIPYAVALMNGDITTKQVVGNPLFSGQTPPVVWADMALYGNLFETEAGADRHNVRQAPLVVMRRSGTTGREDGILRQVIDVAHSRTLTLALDTDKVRAVSDLQRGLRESYAEAVLIGAGEPTWISSDISDVISDETALEAWLQDRSVNQLTAERMREDLASAGALVVLADDAQARWWRTDPSKGDVLIMGPYGGQETSEYIATGFTSLIMLGFFLYGSQSCADSYPDDDEMYLCCLAGNAALTVIGFGAGLVAGPAAIAAGLSGVGYVIWALHFELVGNLGNMVLGEGANYVCSKGLGRR